MKIIERYLLQMQKKALANINAIVPADNLDELFESWAWGLFNLPFTHIVSVLI